jgi:hypothetical protein
MTCDLTGLILVSFYLGEILEITYEFKMYKIIINNIYIYLCINCKHISLAQSNKL